MKKETDRLPEWDLEAIYATPEAWEADFLKIKGLAEEFASYRGKLADGAAVLAEAMEKDDAYSRLAEKVYVYAHLRADENTGISANRARLDRIKSLFAELSPLSAWFMPELSALPDGVIRQYLDAPELASRRRILQEIVRARKHVLSEAEEKIIGLYSGVTRSADNIFSTLNDADLTFGKVRGKTLDHANYHTFLEDGDREIRKAAFRKMHGTYGKFRNTFASTLGATVKRHAVSAKLRGYASALDAALFDDNIPSSVYTGLIDTVHNNLDPVYRYIRLREKVQKLDSIDMYDLYNPLLPNCRRTYSWSDAAKLVQDAVKPLGPEYGKIWQKAFEERWIDAQPRKGKRSGAYSSGMYDTYPYILMSFDHTLNDVFTLAHEGGHSMHSYFSNTHQPYQYADYSIFAAEIASTTNEILLFEHLMASPGADDELKAYLLCHLADEIRCTIYRQTMFAEFELLIHRLEEEGTPLTADLLDKEYEKLNTLYYHVKADRLIRHEWARIPHFYYNFYVYKYATGMSAAIRLATGLLKGGAAEQQAYLGFLKAGSGRDVLDIMQDAGVDLSTPEPVNAALAYFDTVITRLEKMIG